MANEITLVVESALDLSLKGSIGSFKVGSGHDKESLEVKYFLTHVSLNFSGGADEKLLRELAPVREMFDPQQLDFDEIMQRDIDDARVSAELIPYILDDRTQDLIKFFPPIVVIVLPVQEDRNKPASFYPNVSTEVKNEEKQGVEKWLITRSGEVGSEVFEFEQPMLSGEPVKHDLVALRLNTAKCRLVIVDGQHRAMALLALYRNLKDQWEDARRKPYKKYYEEWTPDYIKKFQLSEINLPIIICTVPRLDETYRGDYNLKKASRSIFLTLNKTARKVSRTRNILLDDNDLVSSFLRRTLECIKNVDDRSSRALRIHNIELDQDKQKISSPIAITGVSHIYYMIEHMLLDSGDVVGISQRSGRFRTRTTFSDALDRLHCVDLLGNDAYQSIKRDTFTSEAENILSDEFQRIYGNNIITMFDKFLPFRKHNLMVLKLQQKLKSRSDVDLEAMLFGGQGIVRIFEDHRRNLKAKLKENYFETEAPKIKAIVEELDQTEERLRKVVAEFNNLRADKYVAKSRDKKKFLSEEGSLDPQIIAIVNELYTNVFTTVAFQSAFLCGFFNEYESVSKDFKGQHQINLADIFAEYVEQMNRFFVPQSFSHFKRIVSIFIGKTEGEDAASLRVSRGSSDSFKSVVFPHEMQPDQWPKYRYLMLEIWRPSDSEMSERVRNQLERCRRQVFKTHYERRKKYVAQKHRLTEEELNSEQLEQIFCDSYESYHSFLKHFERASEISKTDMRNVIHEPEENVTDEQEDLLEEDIG